MPGILRMLAPSRLRHPEDLMSGRSIVQGERVQPMALINGKCRVNFNRIVTSTGRIA